MDDNFVFGDIFFSWLIMYWWPIAPQKISALIKKKITKYWGFLANRLKIFKLWNLQCSVNAQISFPRKHRKTVITFDWGLLNHFWVHFSRLHFLIFSGLKFNFFYFIVFAIEIVGRNFWPKVEIIKLVITLY